MTIAGVVLAAGAGRRLGRPKALVEVGGESLVERAVRVLLDAGCDPVVVVLGAGGEALAEHSWPRGVRSVANPDWPSGMGSSLRVGLGALDPAAVQAAVVTLVDLPDVTPELVRRLVAHRGTSAAVVASYGGEPRNPVLLESAVWPQVCAAAVGDVGARAWLLAHPADVRSVPCDDVGSALDVDTLDDLRRVRGLAGQAPDEQDKQQYDAEHG